MLDYTHLKNAAPSDNNDSEIRQFKSLQILENNVLINCKIERRCFRERRKQQLKVQIERRRVSERRNNILVSHVSLIDGYRQAYPSQLKRQLKIKA